ncbi:hypothetical protein PYV50_14950 [Pseudomonas sp. H22_DOA]|nr:hypothetical protein PYV50_14950 [Pseudomonas sp. H22_DOA]
MIALDQTARDLYTVQLKVEEDLRQLKPLHDFCISELTNALSSRWPAVFDVEKDLFSLPGFECGCSPTSTDEAGIETYPHITQTLLQAAMQNFTKDEEADDYPPGSQVRVVSSPSGMAGLTPAAFAKFCRELDLGKRYQEHFQNVFGLVDRAGKVVATSPMTRDIATMKKHLLQMDTHLAGLKQHLTSAGLQTVQRLITADGVIATKTLHYKNRPLIMQGIEILDSCIWGVVVFSERSFELYPHEWCLVYMANEPERPLYEYASFTAFKQYLTQKMRAKRYQQYLANSLDEDDKADFFKTFAKTADLGHIRQLTISVPLFEFMVQSHVGKLQIDARKLAVPTADIDEDVRKKRLLDYLELGVTVATVAGLFVPVVGQLMMGVAVGQLLSQVYEGVEDWQRGDHQAALAHLLSVAENIALMGVFVGGRSCWGRWDVNYGGPIRSFSASSPPFSIRRVSRDCGNLRFRLTSINCPRGSQWRRTPWSCTRFATKALVVSITRSCPVFSTRPRSAGNSNTLYAPRPIPPCWSNTLREAGDSRLKIPNNGTAHPTPSNASIHG